MKTLTILFVILSMGIGAQAAKTEKKSTQPVPAAAGKSAKVGTNHSFEGHSVGGKIQAPFESLTVVENEKSIDDLIGVRQNFLDRSEKAKGLR